MTDASQKPGFCDERPEDIFESRHAVRREAGLFFNEAEPMNRLLRFYLAMGSATCGWFLLACILGWRAPDLGIVRAMNSPSSGGRSSGGFWGGGK
jgi:hypothetical protein